MNQKSSTKLQTETNEPMDFTFKEISNNEQITGVHEVRENEIHYFQG